MDKSILKFSLLMVSAFLLVTIFTFSSDISISKDIVDYVKETTETLIQRKNEEKTQDSVQSINLNSIEAYQGINSIEINGNKPYFTENDYQYFTDTNEFIKLEELDKLGRTQSAMMIAGPETVLREERENISEVKPSGWKQKQYDFIENGGWLYNRCHLLAHSLSNLNTEPRNLITCTRQANATGMYYYEIALANYIEETQNHILYRVTPIYKGNDLVATGILMEAKSIEDDEIELCVYVYNVQDGVKIDYLTGESFYE